MEVRCCFTQKHETKHSHYKELIHMECETLKTFYKKEQSYIQYIKHLRTQKPISVNAEAVMSQVIKLFIAKCRLNLLPGRAEAILEVTEVPGKKFLRNAQVRCGTVHQAEPFACKLTVKLVPRRTGSITRVL